MTRLSETERKVLAHIHLNAHKSIRELARQSGTQLHTVQRLIARLREAGELRKVWIVNPLAIGFQRCHFFFSTALRTRSQREKLLKSLCRSEYVYSLSEIAGRYDYGVILLTRGVREAKAKIEELTAPFGDIFFEKNLSIQTAVAYFPRKYLVPGKPLVLGKVEVNESSRIVKIDKLDHCCLRLLSENADISRRELAARSGVSVVTIDNRLRSLQERGILLGALFRMPSSLFGSTRHRLLLTTRGFSAARREQLFEFARAHRNCTNFREWFGGADYELGIEVESMEHVVTVKEELLQMFGDFIVSVEILSSLKLHKYSPYPFMSFESTQ